MSAYQEVYYIISISKASLSIYAYHFQVINPKGEYILYIRVTTRPIDLHREMVIIKRALLTKFLLLALLVLQTREVSADDSRLESSVHDELQFVQGLGFPSIITSFHGATADDMLV